MPCPVCKSRQAFSIDEKGICNCLGCGHQWSRFRDQLTDIQVTLEELLELVRFIRDPEYFEEGTVISTSLKAERLITTTMKRLNLPFPTR